MDRDIAVIGLSCVFPGAADADEFWANNVNAVDAVGPIPPQRWPNTDFARLPLDHESRIACTRGGFLSAASIDARRFGLMPNQIRNGDADQFVMVMVADRALQDAGIADDSPLRQRTDVIVGRGGYISVKMAETFLRIDLVSRVMPMLRQRFPQLSAGEAADLETMLRNTLPPHDPECYTTCIPNLVASRACNRLNLRGSAFVVDGACASSLLAVEQAVERLRNRQCDLALAAGLHLCQNPPFWFVFTHLRALSASGVIRPFDSRADGMLLGEGAGAVVLKRLADAYRDGDRIYAIIKGAGSASDGRDTGVLLPSPNGQLEALRRAYADAGVDPQTISLLEAHGTATPAGDTAEIETIKRFYGTSAAPTKVMGSVKSMIGHAMPAAGIAALIRTVLALTHKVLPPTINCQQPRAELRDAPFYVLDEARPWVHSPGDGPRRAGVNAFGFGGINAHVVLEEVPQQATPPIAIGGRLPSAEAAGGPCARPFRDARTHQAELVLFSAASRAELTDRLCQLKQFLDRPNAKYTLADVAFSCTQSVDFAQPVKLAIVCGDLDELRETLATCLKSLDAGEAPGRSDKAVHYSESAAIPLGKVAVMFPGMAFPGLIGNFPKHLLQMALHFPALREVLDRFEGKDGCPDDPIPFSCILSPPRSFSPETRELLQKRVAPPEAVNDPQAVTAIPPQRRNLSGVGMALSNWLGWKLLQRLKIRPDMVCGQSAGDLAAMAVAGVLDFENDVVPQLWEGLSIPADYLACGCMAFVAADDEQLRPFLIDKPNTYVAIDVTPEAKLLGGKFEEIGRLCAQLREAQIIAVELPFLPGHTPLLEYMKDKLAYAVDDRKILGPPQIPAYSALSAERFPNDPQGIRKLLTANLVEPVRFWQTNRRLYQDGARIFIQAGCGTVAANVPSVLDDPEVVAVAVDAEDRDPLAQLCLMVGMLFAAGVQFDPAVLFEHRAVRLVDFDGEPAELKSPGEVEFPLRWGFGFTGADAAISPETDNAIAKPQAAQAAGEMPFVRKVVHFVPNEEIVLEHTLGVDDDLYLRDHHFVAAADVKPIEHCLPVMPLVMMIEAMGEAAAQLTPGAGVIGLEDLRALRWIDLDDDPHPTILIRARLAATDEQLGVHYVQAEIVCNERVCTTATVLLAAEYREDLQLVFSELDQPGPWPITAEGLYSDHHTFHGPRFQTVSGLDVLADNGLLGRLRVLSKDDLFSWQPQPQLFFDPAVIDGAGQLLGSWSQTRGGYVLPVGIDKLELYGPPPAPGTEVPIRLQITRFDLEANAASCDIEMLDGEGYVWMRIRGWRDRIFFQQSKFMEMHRFPRRRCFSTIKTLPGLPPEAVYAEISPADLDGGSNDTIALLHLTVAERARMKTMLGKRRREFLLGRIAAKDAVRCWLAQQAGSDEMLHPAAVSIGQHEGGQPFVEPIPGLPRLPQISLAHTDGRTVAVAAAEAVGIDVEPLTRPTAELLEHFAKGQEAEMIQSLAEQQPAEAWPTRLWCAKESVSKALGTGLGGQLGDFRLTAVEDGGALHICHRPTARQLVATTIRDHDMILAYSNLPSQGA